MSVPRGRGRRPPPSESTSSSSNSDSISLPMDTLTLSSTSQNSSISFSQRGFRAVNLCGPRSPGVSPGTPLQPQNIVPIKQGTLDMKKGETPVSLLSNYFEFEKTSAWKLYQYLVTFNPPLVNKRIRQGIMKIKKEDLGKAFVFDGSTLTTMDELPPDQLNFQVSDKKNLDQHFNIKLRLVKYLEAGDATFFHVFNSIIRKCMFNMELTEVGRNFFDSHASISIPKYGLTLWPGYLTSVRQHDGGMLLCVDTMTRVLRTDSVLNTLEKIKAQFQNNISAYEAAAKKEIVGSIMLSTYNNNKCYKIADIDFSKNPLSTFEKRVSNDKTQSISYFDYFTTQYPETKITNMDQPLLVAEPKKQNDYENQNQVSHGLCLLVPELCKMTGLTDDMRTNFSLMRELSGYFNQDPEQRVAKILSFMRKLQETPENKKELNSWGLKLSSELVTCQGRILPREGILFARTRGNENPLPAGDDVDWTMAFRKCQMLTSIPLERWVIIVPQKDSSDVNMLIQAILKVSTPMNFIVQRPIIHIIADQNPSTTAYRTAIKQVIAEYDRLQMVFVILANNRPDCYGAVKKILSVDNGIPSQCFLAKKIKSKGLTSIATKVAIQMNVKLGGQPWSVQIPIKKLMVVGFDEHRGSAGESNGKSVGALVATTNANLSEYFSCVSYHQTGSELSTNLCSNLLKCLNAYQTANGELPEKIMFYRDGVGDGQLQYVADSELSQILQALEGFYKSAEREKPKLTFIVVTRKINTRLFTDRRGNPSPGSVCDDVVTLPERYDFFLVPQMAKKGTVNPCSYNVLRDDQNLQPGRLQQFTYKLCHLYYNWSGTVAVPAPCQYAHKLAFHVGTVGSTAHEKLSFKLHYL